MAMGASGAPICTIDDVLKRQDCMLLAHQGKTLDIIWTVREKS